MPNEEFRKAYEKATPEQRKKMLDEVHRIQDPERQSRLDRWGNESSR